VALDQCRDAPLAAFEAASARLVSAGARVEPVAFPDLAEAMGLSAILFTTEAYGIWRERIEAAPEVMYAPIRERFRSGAQFSGPDFVAAWRRLREIRAGWTRAFAGFDAVLAPTAAILPPDAMRLQTDPDYFAAENLLALRNTRIGNLMGLAALTLPTGTPACGIMLMGPAMGEEALLRLGAAAEAALAG
jgi:aspartyl-tRNA(Asn)/glutamyl-tRNA(Gln) amidotransferase subunit A